MRVPDCSAHSIAMTSSESPDIMRLRDGKVCFAARVFGFSSEISVPPCCKICFARFLFVAGYKTESSSPDPITAIVVSLASIAVRCATASMPIARPETMMTG